MFISPSQLTFFISEKKQFTFFNCRLLVEFIFFNSQSFTFLKEMVLRNKKNVLVNLAQLVGIMHRMCKVWGSNPNYHKKKMVLLGFSLSAL